MPTRVSERSQRAQRLWEVTGEYVTDPEAGIVLKSMTVQSFEEWL